MPRTKLDVRVLALEFALGLKPLSPYDLIKESKLIEKYLLDKEEDDKDAS